MSRPTSALPLTQRVFTGVEAEAQAALLQLREEHKALAGYLYHLMRDNGANTLAGLFALQVDTVETWLARTRAPRSGKTARAAVSRERGELRRAMRALCDRLDCPLPNWAKLPIGQAPASRGSLQWWSASDPWRPDLEGVLSTVKGSQRGASYTSRSLLRILSHYRSTLGPGDSRALGVALLDPHLVPKTFERLVHEGRETNRKRRNEAHYGEPSLKRAIECLRPVFIAATIHQRLSPASEAALVKEYGRKGRLTPRQASQGFNEWKEDTLALAKSALTVPLNGHCPVGLPPVRLVVQIETGAFGRYEKLRRAHLGHGLSLDDFERWREWDPEYRNLLCLWFGFRALWTGGARIGSLHALQPALSGRAVADDPRFADAVTFRRVIAKNIPHDGSDEPNTDDRNVLYGDDAPGQQCAEWTFLGALRGLPGYEPQLTLRRLLELALHATGQCSGQPRCPASPVPVYRQIEVSSRHDAYRYEEVRRGKRRPIDVSRNGEWLSGLCVPTNRSVGYTTVWFDLSGNRPLLLSGLKGRLNTFIDQLSDRGRHLHQWRHFSFHYLTRVAGFSCRDAARLIHMQEATAQKIYDNPDLDEVLKAYANASAPSAAPTPPDLSEALARASAAEQEAAEYRHKIQYAEAVLGRPLPEPPTKLPAAELAKTVRQRVKRAPLGSARFVA